MAAIGTRELRKEVIQDADGLAWALSWRDRVLDAAAWGKVQDLNRLAHAAVSGRPSLDVSCQIGIGFLVADKTVWNLASGGAQSAALLAETKWREVETAASVKGLKKKTFETFWRQF